MADIENKMKVIEISPCLSEKVKRVVELRSPASTPLRPIFCLKRNVDMEHIEKMEDYFILHFDSFESTDKGNLSAPENLSTDDDHIAIISEKGQVACRDYPHPRHLCVRFPFDTVPHERHCELCYCYVCDLVLSTCARASHPMLQLAVVLRQSCQS